MRIKKLPGKSFLPLIACLSMIGCQGIPDLTGGPPSHAVRPIPNPSFAAAAAVPTDSESSAVALLTDGSDALAARIALARKSRQSLDIQYYIWDGDESGSILLEELLSAADRGVRVRLLLDDANTSGLLSGVLSELTNGLRAVAADLEDGAALLTPEALERRDRMRVMMKEIRSGGRMLLVGALDTHPNVEVRLFNPFASTGVSALKRYLEIAGDFHRLNRRMHNKVFAADNQMAIVGGRNIGDVYFGRHHEHNFRDLDLIVAGPAVRDVTRNFDLYWNSHWAMPVRSFAWEGTSQNRLAQLRKELREFQEERKGILTDPDHPPLEPERALAGAISRMRSAPVHVVADTPDKIGGDGEPRVASKLGSLAAQCESEILIETAYFVPSNRTFARVEERLGHGVRVRALTNSLSSNDVLAAHSGYARHRKSMLLSGVEIHELATRGSAVPPDSPKSRLHTKAVVFDRKRVFVGTFNLDPRSSELNTEIGLLVDSPELAEEVCAFIEKGMEPTRSWRLAFRDPDNSEHGGRGGKLVWHMDGTDPPTVKYKDPQATAASRMIAKVLSWLPLDPLL
ncbi:MAG: phospholipase D family protein [Luteolibacter sp.]